MKIAGVYWLSIAFLAVALAACATHGSMPATVAPVNGVTQITAPDEGTSQLEPDAKACYTHRVQPRWIFRGACRTHRISGSGSVLKLRAYRGYSVVLKIPPNDAARRHRPTLLADATGSGDVRPFKHKAFPLDGNAFLYLEIVNRGKPIVFRKGSKVALTVANTSFPAGPCGIATLRDRKGHAAWRALRVTANPSGTTLSFTIPASVDPRIRIDARYFALFCQQAPSPSPSPSSSPSGNPSPSPSPSSSPSGNPSPSPSPSSSPTPPNYCSSYTVYSGGYPVFFDDDSGQTLHSYIYVTDGRHYLNTKGVWKIWNAVKSLQPSSYEYPLSCYTKTPFHLPTGAGIRVYVSYGTLTVGQLNSSSKHSVSYNLEPNCCERPSYPTTFQNPNYYKLWDYWEYSSSGSGMNLDSTQVDAFALPFYITVTNPAAGGLISLGPKSYAGVVNAFKASSLWSKLIVYGAGASSSSVLRIMSPGSATQTYGGYYKNTFDPNFPYDLFYNATYFPYGYAGQAAAGYLAYVEAYFASAAPGLPNYKKIVFAPYQTQYGPGSPACNEYTSGLSGGSTVCPTYYAYYDSNGFEFSLTPYSPSTGSSASFPSKVTLPVSDFEQGPMGNNIWQPVALPYKTSYSLTARVTFNLYKALAVDITRGVATQVGYHPVLPCSSATNCQQSFSPQNGVYGSYNYYQTTNVVSGLPALSCGYCLLLHQTFHHGRAYATPYDDYMNQSTDTTSTASSTITVTIEPMSPAGTIRRAPAIHRRTSPPCHRTDGRSWKQRCQQ